MENLPTTTTIKKKRVLLICVAAALLLLTATLVGFAYQNKSAAPRKSPLAKQLKNPTNLFGDINQKEVDVQPKSELQDKEVLNVMLFGIDRRSKVESAYRTDIMILLSVNKKDKKVVLTSIPRDLWFKNGRLNALYIQEGFEAVAKAVFDITGQKPERFVLTDFEDFSWIIDQLGGVNVNVATTFTDNQYPIDATKEYQTVNFIQGPELLTGERALIFARSRKGDNDNGDWGRMRRQHLILKGLLTSVLNPQGLLCKNTQSKSLSECENKVTATELKYAFEMITSNRMDTNLQLIDITYLWDLFKYRDQYETTSLLLDYDYLYVPPMEEYGGAWVLAPINDSYEPFKNKVTSLLKGLPVHTEVQTEVQQPTNNQTP